MTDPIHRYAVKRSQGFDHSIEVCADYYEADEHWVHFIYGSQKVASFRTPEVSHITTRPAR